MRVLNAAEISQTVTDLVVKANYLLPADTLAALETLERKEQGLAKEVAAVYLKNARVAQTNKLPICQDTGSAVFFLEIGEELHINGNLDDAVNEGVAKGYQVGSLRKSVVNDPLFDRKNTGDNTPALLHLSFVKGDKLTLHFLPKGAGSENMSALCMMNPSQGVAGVEKLVLDTVQKADANPCPPVIVGVGIGGNFETSALLAKRAMLRSIGSTHKDPRYAKLEKEWLVKINRLGIGPQGFGGKTTALAVFLEYAPCHMASLPIAVNIGCHVHRHLTAEL